MKRMSKSTVLLLSTILVVVGGGGAVYWQFSQRSELESKVAALAKKAQGVQELKTALERSAKELHTYGEKLHHLEKGIPELAYIPTLLTELEATGRLHGIEVLGVRPIPPRQVPKKNEKDKPEKKPYIELDIEVKGRGGYYAVLSFLDALQTFPKIAAVRSVGMMPKNVVNQVGPPKLDVTVEVRTYLFREAAKRSTDLSTKRESSAIPGG